MARTDTKPPLPFALGSGNRAALEQTDEEYVPITWEQLKGAIDSGDVSVLSRKPSVLRKYISWTALTRQKYGSVAEFVCQRKLEWTPLEEPSIAGYQFDHISEEPLSDSRDYRILRNDWPYGVEEDIEHLIVWSKVRFECQPEGQLTDGSARLIERFLNQVFPPRPQHYADLLWFKNGAQYQTIAALEHIHIILRRADQTWIEHLTGQKKSAIEALKVHET